MVETALILGGSGFLGAHLVRAWRGAWPAIRCVSAARNPEHGATPGAVVHAWDALDAGSTERLFSEFEPGVVISAAALSRVGDCEREPDLAVSLNTELPGRLARLAEERGVRMLHISTDLVFGGRPAQGERYSEADQPSPLGHYGATKAAGEEQALAAGALVVRLPLLFGESGGAGAGASDGLFAALGRGERPGLFSDEWRTPLEVGSAARALVELAGGGAQGLLHLAGAVRLSRFELGCRLLRAAGMGDSASELRCITRAEAGMATRASDVSLDASRALGLIRSALIGAPVGG